MRAIFQNDQCSEIPVRLWEKLLDHLHIARDRHLQEKVPRNSYWAWLSRINELREDGVHC